MSRLQQQLAKKLADILADPLLAQHAFFDYWNKPHAQITPAQLCDYCVTKPAPHKLLVDIIEAAKEAGLNIAAAQRDAAAADATLLELCCHMCLVVCERMIYGEVGGVRSLEKGVLNVGMFAREAAAIVAAVWIGCGLKLELRPGTQQFRVLNLIHEFGEQQLGMKTFEDVLDEEVDCYAQRTRFPISPPRRGILPEIVLDELERAEQRDHVRPFIAINRAQGYQQVDEAFRQRFWARWKVDMFFHGSSREELSPDAHKRWCQLENTLLKYITETLNAGVTPPGVPMLRGAKVFISYAHEDEQHRKDLVAHLGGLEAQGLIESWDDTKIGTGRNWYEEIDRCLQTCRVAVMVISIDFLNSKFISTVEVRQLLLRHKEGGLLLMPVLMRDCNVDNYSWLKALQIFPRGGKPVAVRRPKRETQLKEFSDEIARELNQRPS